MKGNDRLNPTIFHTRYVHLTRLRDATIKIIDELTADNKNLLLADFGCGDMPYRSVIEPKVGKYLGIDLEMNPKAEHHIGFDSKTTLPDNYVDIILSNQVLEHVDTPSGYLQEAYRILKPGGTMILTTHGYWFYHPTPNDYWRWTSAGLRKTVEAEKFKITSFHGIMGLAASGIQLFQDAILNKSPKFLYPSIAFVMQGFIGLFDKINTQQQRDRDASLYIVIAQKPLDTV
ncbi:Methyltransferase domain-containing protein [Mucilaginibacter mallensis]|uniref:Methyltransferase domain-containing protein n=1 Tax=Mucilaginibacter mallensis TaxID=652787 RepID=A0A1H1NHL1_MUCMA|nr:class I SAM-dependent methyltransferase [Mucilaginibacter mallensis]SDR98417.1 Methyltransferase domain-containing protein [Mucilaginibacter mallensis]